MGRKNREYTHEEYKKAMELLKKGYGLSETCRILGWPETKRSLLYHWKHGRVPPLARWKAEPCVELAYVIGSLEDGCVYRYEPNYEYKIELETIDPEFGENFSRSMSKVLGVGYHKPCWNEKHSAWVVKYKSKAFVKWYEKCKMNGLEGFKPYIEYDKSTVTAFLRGLYDAEGNNYRCRRISLSNANINLLHYVQYLLSKYFNIDTRGPYLEKKAGTIHTKRNGERVKSKHDGYRIDINKKEHVQKFIEEIGFTISRKQLGLKKS